MNRSNGEVADWSISPGADFLQLSVADAPAGGRSAWLAGELRAAISDGRLPVGSGLPATRVLAAELRVSRGVVTEAYQRLVEDGHVVGRGRAGTVVVAAPVVPPPPGHRAEADTPDSRPGARTSDSRVASVGLAGFPHNRWVRVLSEPAGPAGR
ncbi:MAG: GntR family transcriptional regulator [Actinophytocola sp.]|nr:GntR family transcriptional regulator [Actinophytocola sp.]